MGSIRNLQFDAVIGIGALTSTAKRHGINGRINWIGVGAHRQWSGPVERKHVALLRFERFLLMDSDGPFVDKECPALASRFYEMRARYLLQGMTVQEQMEASQIILSMERYAQDCGCPILTFED